MHAWLNLLRGNVSKFGWRSREIIAEIDKYLYQEKGIRTNCLVKYWFFNLEFAGGMLGLATFLKL